VLTVEIYNLPICLHLNELHLLEQHSKPFKTCSAIIRINIEGKSLIMQLTPGCLFYDTKNKYYK